MQVGFIGLGVMGLAMTRNIIRGGFSVTVWNRTLAKAEKARELGATVASSPRELASQVEVLLTCVGKTADVEEVLTGEQGVFQGIRPGSIVIDTSTISPEATQRLAKLAATRQAVYLDAPVTGGDIGAKNGTLSIMVGGDGQALERVKALLETMGTITHCGPVGSGQMVKACNQIMCGLNLLGVVEALSFATKAGIDPELMVNVTKNGAGSSWALQNLAPRIIKGDDQPGFSVKFQQKDLAIVLEEAERMALPMLGTSLVHQLLRSLQAHGGDEHGTQSLMKFMERIANI